MKKWRKQFTNDLTKGQPQYTKNAPEILFMVNAHEDVSPNSFECISTMQKIAHDLNLPLISLTNIPNMRLKYLKKQEKLLCYFDYLTYLQSTIKVPWEVIIDAFHKEGLELTTGYTDMPGVAGFELVITKTFNPNYHAILLDASRDFLAHYAGKAGYLAPTMHLKDLDAVTKLPEIYALALINNQGRYFLTLPMSKPDPRNIPVPVIPARVSILNQMLTHTPLIRSGQTCVYEAYFRKDYYNNPSLLFECVCDREDYFNKYLLTQEAAINNSKNNKQELFPGLTANAIKILKKQHWHNLKDKGQAHHCLTGYTKSIAQAQASRLVSNFGATEQSEQLRARIVAHRKR